MAQSAYKKTPELSQYLDTQVINWNKAISQFRWKSVRMECNRITSMLCLAQNIFHVEGLGPSEALFLHFQPRLNVNWKCLRVIEFSAKNSLRLFRPWVFRLGLHDLSPISKESLLRLFVKSLCLLSSHPVLHLAHLQKHLDFWWRKRWLNHLLNGCAPICLL